VADSKPTIVFLHGTRLTGASWTVQVAALSDEFHCLTPDLLGHGVSATESFTVAGAAEHVAGVIEREARDGRAILVGLSLGGYVAMDVAARWPERVSGLVLSGVTAEPVGIRSGFYRALATVFNATPPSLLGRINRRYFGWRYPPSVADPILAAGFGFDGGAIALRALVGERFKPRLAAYPGPSLLINGEYDLFFRPTEPGFARVAANPRRVLIRRATHLVPFDQPDAFADVVRTFARSIAAADR
jgi:pimeloyl-ACP methyl ester carboxylesterase